MLLFDMHADFFSRFVLQRNRFIRRVELFEESSILLLLRWFEASEWQFLKLFDKQWNLLREEPETCPMKKCR